MRPISALRGSARARRQIDLAPGADARRAGRWRQPHRGFLPSGDCLATLGCVRALGIEVEVHSDTALTVRGRGLRGLRPPVAASGLCPLGHDDALAGRHPGRPAFDMRADRRAAAAAPPDAAHHRPAAPRWGPRSRPRTGTARCACAAAACTAATTTCTVASAQVKSALLLAGLYADGPTVVRQCGPARDHTERMLARMGAALDVDGLDVTLHPPAAAVAALVPRAGRLFFGGLSAGRRAAGAGLTRSSSRGWGSIPRAPGCWTCCRLWGRGPRSEDVQEQGGEPVADLIVAPARLRGVEVGGDTIVRMIDEFPILAVAATQARGRRWSATPPNCGSRRRIALPPWSRNWARWGRDRGTRGWVCGLWPDAAPRSKVDSHGDHRLAMALAVAGLVASGETVDAATRILSSPDSLSRIPQKSASPLAGCRKHSDVLLIGNWRLGIERVESLER